MTDVEYLVLGFWIGWMVQFTYNFQAGIGDVLYRCCPQKKWIRNLWWSEQEMIIKGYDDLLKENKYLKNEIKNFNGKLRHL